MNILQTVLIITIVLTSCTNKQENAPKQGIFSKFSSTTNNEDNGINEISKYYGGKCECEKHVSVSTESGTKKSFALVLSQSEVIEEQAKLAQMPASNIAYHFFRT